MKRHVFIEHGHGTLGCLLCPIDLLVAIYALSLGRARLKPPAHAAALAALALAVGSGKLMQENWLRTGQLSHTVYTLHLTAWLLLGVTVMWHLAAVLRRGGPALAASMLRWQVRSQDHPRHWPQQLRRGLRRGSPPDTCTNRPTAPLPRADARRAPNPGGATAQSRCPRCRGRVSARHPAP